MPRSWVSCASFRFVIVPGAHTLPGSGNRVLPGPPKANESQLHVTFRMLQHTPTEGLNGDSFFWAIYFFNLQKLVNLKKSKVSNSAKLIAAYYRKLS